MTDPQRLIAEAMQAQFADDLRAWDAATALLAADSTAEKRLRAALDQAAADTGRRGWRQEDLARHLTRFRSAVHADLLSNGPGKGLEATSRAIDVLCTLSRLPRIAELQRGERQNHPALGRIRALLAKAESTEYPDEAEALVARAQQLMARHSLGKAALEDPSEAPTGMRLGIDNPYEEAKATLLHVIAEANRCRAVWHSELAFSTVLGFPADLDAVELLFTSLLVQADGAMPKNGSKRRFRHSFLTSYAHHIGERLSRTAEAEVTEDLLPVLARRDQAVDSAVDRLFPQLKTVRARRIQDMEGWEQGKKAAARADLG